MMTNQDVVIITGGSGFIGSAIIEKLAGQFTLVGFDRVAKGQPPPAAECVCIDLTSEEAVKGAFERVRIAYGKRIASIIHLAAYYDLSGKPNPLYEKITLSGTELLLKYLKGFEVEQFVFASTMLVHAPTLPGKPIREDSPLEPRWPYPLSKVETEALIREQRGNIPIAILRMAGVYDDEGHNPFLAQQIARIYERQILSHFYPGNVRHGQSFIHLEDVCQALLRLVEKRHELPSESVLLLGEPETMSYEEIQQSVAQLLQQKSQPIKKIPKPFAKLSAWMGNEILQENLFIKPWMIDLADDHYELDITRARTMLGWKPKYSLKACLPKIIENLKNNPKRWYRENKLNEARVATPLKSSAEKKTQQQDEIQRIVTEQKDTQEHDKMMAHKHKQTLWAHFINIGLGAWLAFSAFVFGLFDKAATFDPMIWHVTSERGLASPQWRNAILGANDIASGFLIMLFGALSLWRRTSWAQWANTFVGLWLLFAPLIFWSPSSTAYNNDLIIGMLVIAFSILIPMMPGMSMKGMMDPGAIPPGWTYSPSTWAQRLPIILMGLIGFLIARKLTAYQLGHVHGVWEPFFRGESGLNGTETIITSDVSKAWPIPDAGLGAVSYALEILMACMGDRTRWRTMPWMVTFFGILVVPLGVVSIYFIIIQPIVIGTWCTLCLLAALAMLIMIPFALDELVAMGQFLVWAHRAGKPFWRTFLRGDAMVGSTKAKSDSLTSPRTATIDMMRGLTFPWTLLSSAIIGLFFLFTRLFLGTTGVMANSDHLVGSLIITVAIIATAEVARPLRFINVLFGLWLMLAPWIISGGSYLAAGVSVLLGIALIMLSLPRGKRGQEHYGSWDNYVV
ncbi:DNA polymerase III subunit epsilon [Coxiella burnetii]|nr:DNA polymerase III subunit epsilon [Coxiella burnetii]